MMTWSNGEPMASVWKMIWWAFRDRCLRCGGKRMPGSARCFWHVRVRMPVGTDREEITYD